MLPHLCTHLCMSLGTRASCIYIYTFRALVPEAWEAGRLGGWEADVMVPCGVFGSPIYTFGASIPDAWEARRLADWLGGWLAVS